jgi:hypothetical protein
LFYATYNVASNAMHAGTLGVSAMASKHIVPNLSGATLTVGRWDRGPSVNLVSTSRPVALTEEETGWTAEPWKLKPRQFGKLELEKRLLGLSDVPAGAPLAFKGSKSAFGKRYQLAEMFAVVSVFVSGDFQGEGYGLAMYLKALELVSVKGYWLVNDTKHSTSAGASATWRALFRYADKTLEGPPPPQQLFDYEKQAWAVGYSANALSNRPTVVDTHRPVFAAFGLNRTGLKALQS